MQIPAERQDTRLMRAMFGTIAPRYDFFTRAFSYGMDRGWKRAGLKLAQLPPRPLVLDLASGTGDFRCWSRRSIPAHGRLRWI